MDQLINFSNKIDLCVAYTDYLKSGFASNETNNLVKSLEQNDLLAQVTAMRTLFEKGEGWYSNIQLYKPWQNLNCYVGQLPPKIADVGTLWFDPYELSFMVRIVNPPGMGGVQGWLGIEPVRHWQYYAFLRLSNIQNKHSPFSADIELFNDYWLKNKTKYISDIYSLEAGIYSRWHGKRITLRFEFKAALYYLSLKQVEAIFPTEYVFWDPSISGIEELAGYYSCEILSEKAEEEIKEQYERILKLLRTEVCSEWFKDKKISMIIHLPDKLGLTAASSYPIEDEYVILKNCVRNL